MSRRLSVVTASLAMLAAGPAAAQQVAVDLVPFAGAYLPMADVYDWSDTEVGITATITGKHKTGFAFGGRLTLWFNDAFGLEGGFAYGPSDVDYDLTVRGDGLSESVSTSVSASVWRGSLKGILNLVRSADAPVNFYVGGGIGLVGRSGDGYEQFVIQFFDENLVFENEGTTDVGGVLNVGVAFDVSELIAIRIDLEDYIHSVKQTLTLEGESFESDSKLQNDLLLTGGVAIRLGR
ncbi:MAG: outer membrane beta-barrel protein [Gemmatimonadota bacterium]|nr:MAG: outer membrane beta-barrel protein [Gemmatimonadota bacterium]